MGSLETKPYLISFSVTTRCALSCPHCFMDAGLFNYDTPIDRIAKIIERLRRVSEDAMLIITGGEPLLREDIDEVVAIASEKGFITVLGTAGTRKGIEKMEDLKDRGLRGVSVSLDSPKPSYHDRFRGVAGSWAIAVRTLERARELGIETQINTTLTDSNWKEVKEIVDLGVELGVKAVNFFFIVCTGRASRTFISTENYEKALRRIAELSLEERRIMVRPRCAPHVYRFLLGVGIPVMGGMRGCPAGRYYLRIDHMGNLYPCPYLPLSLGNVIEDDPYEVWLKSPLLKRLRQEEYGGKCGVCRYRILCGGCRARALSEHGDLMGPDPLCDYEPEGIESPLPLPELEEKLVNEVEWTEEARSRMERLPLFLRGIVVRMVEKRAKEEGVSRITPEFLKRVRRESHG